MSKATLTFDLPAEADEHGDALNGAGYRLLIEDLLSALRDVVKYGGDGCFGDAMLRDALTKRPGAAAAADLRKAIYDEAAERGLPLT
jgi:hypothetical protein